MNTNIKTNNSDKIVYETNINDTLIIDFDGSNINQSKLNKIKIINNETHIEKTAYEQIPFEPVEELAVEDNIVGSGAIVSSGNAVYIHYVGFSASTGEQFDSSWDRGRTEFIGYVSGIGNVIEGLDQGQGGYLSRSAAPRLLAS